MNKNTINSSVAKCLGSLVVTEHLLDLYHEKNYNIYSELVNDKEAVNACLQFCGRFQCMNYLKLEPHLPGLHLALCMR